MAYHAPFLTMAPLSPWRSSRSFAERMASIIWYPEPNWLAEHGVGIVKEALSKQRSIDVQCMLDRILLWYQNVPHTTTGQSSAMLLLGCRQRGHLDQLWTTQASGVEGQQLSQKYHDMHTKMKEFTPGDVGYVCQKGLGSSWILGTVLSQDKQIAYMACNGVGTIHRHLSHVRPRYDVRIQPEQQPIIIEPVVATDQPCSKACLATVNSFDFHAGKNARAPQLECSFFSVKSNELTQ